METSLLADMIKNVLLLLNFDMVLYVIISSQPHSKPNHAENL